MVHILHQSRPFGDRKHLVIVRPGPGSLHVNWGGSKNRSFDLCAFQYGENNKAAPVNEDFIAFEREGTGFSAIWRFLTDYRLSEKYETYWFPDDDIETSEELITAYFDIVEHYGLALAQPALAEGSYVSHRITRQRPEYVVRFTNFVEAMMPSFSREALFKILPSFRGSVTAWGLDLSWAKILGVAPTRMGIVDATPMRHTRPVGGGSLYATAKNMGVHPAGELKANLKRFGAENFQFEHYGGVLRTPEVTPWPKPRFE